MMPRLKKYSKEADIPRDAEALDAARFLAPRIEFLSYSDNRNKGWIETKHNIHMYIDDRSLNRLYERSLDVY